MSDLARLIMLQGQQNADWQREKYDRLGSAVSNLGATIGGAIEQKREQKAIAARDQAIFDLMANPQATPKDFVRVAGPELGEKFWKASDAFKALQAEPTPEMAMKTLPLQLEGFLALSPSGRAAAYGPLKDGLVKSQIIPPGSLPDQYDQAQIDPLAKTMLQRLGGGSKTREIKVRNPDGSESIQIVEDKPGQQFTSAAEPPKDFEWVTRQGRPVQIPKGSAMAGDVPYSKPERAPTPQLERVETVDDQGRPVTKFVTPSAGAAYAKPTGAGKPATGQQRRALSFFNRMKEADEIAAALEEGQEINPTTLRYTPEKLNVLMSNPNQSYRQAQRAFTEARLRKESGANIKESEYENDAITYFAQPGDSEETKRQKRAMRQAVKAGIAFESGDALREFYGDDAEGMLQELQGASHQKPPAKIQSDDEYNALPSGSLYVAPDGTTRRKN